MISSASTDGDPALHELEVVDRRHRARQHLVVEDRRERRRRARARRPGRCPRRTPPRPRSAASPSTSARTNAAVRSLPGEVAVVAGDHEHVGRVRRERRRTPDASPSVTLRNPACSSAVERVDAARGRATTSRSTRSPRRRRASASRGGRGRRRVPARRLRRAGARAGRARRRASPARCPARRAPTGASCTRSSVSSCHESSSHSTAGHVGAGARAARAPVCFTTPPSTPRSATTATDWPSSRPSPTYGAICVDELLELRVLLARAACSSALRSLFSLRTLLISRVEPVDDPLVDDRRADEDAEPEGEEHGDRARRGETGS